jgi:hypothetical protein
MSSSRINPEALPAHAGYGPTAQGYGPPAWRPLYGDSGIDVKRAFKYVFEQPGWVSFLLKTCAYLFIPIVGNFAVQGYGVRLFRHFVRTGDDRNLPPMTGLGDLISLGIAPAAASMIWMFPMVFIAQILLMAGMAVSALAGFAVGGALKAGGADERAAVVAGVVVGAICFLFTFILFYFSILLMSYYLMGMMTLVEHTGKIEYAWKFREIKEFMRVLQPDYRRAFIGLQLRSLLYILPAYFCCVFLIFPALVIVILAGTHLRAQLYHLYLARGGAPLPMDAKM